MGEYDEAIGRLDERVRALAEQMDEQHAAILARIDGGGNVPYEQSLRARVHKLEKSAWASEASTAALAEAQRERKQAQRERKHAQSDRSAYVWRWVGAVIAVGAIVAPYAARIWL